MYATILNAFMQWQFCASRMITTVNIVYCKMIPTAPSLNLIKAPAPTPSNSALQVEK